jgi:hypothetical protein
MTPPSPSNIVTKLFHELNTHVLTSHHSTIRPVPLSVRMSRQTHQRIVQATTTGSHLNESPTLPQKPTNPLKVLIRQPASPRSSIHPILALHNGDPRTD